MTSGYWWQGSAFSSLSDLVIFLLMDGLWTVLPLCHVVASQCKLRQMIHAIWAVRLLMWGFFEKVLSHTEKWRTDSKGWCSKTECAGISHAFGLFRLFPFAIADICHSLIASDHHFQGISSCGFLSSALRQENDLEFSRCHLCSPPQLWYFTVLLVAVPSLSAHSSPSGIALLCQGRKLPGQSIVDRWLIRSFCLALLHFPFGSIHSLQSASRPFHFASMASLFHLALRPKIIKNDPVTLDARIKELER
jgi:hypothetical protein